VERAAATGNEEAAWLRRPLHEDTADDVEGGSQLAADRAREELLRAVLGAGGSHADEAVLRPAPRQSMTAITFRQSCSEGFSRQPAGQPLSCGSTVV
jgi:hypothetical protein